MKEITLSKGEVVQVDDEDFERLSKYQWCSNIVKGVCYPIRYYGANEVILLGQEILNLPKRTRVFHENGDPLDFRKDNLTLSHSHGSKKKREIVWGKSKYKGVSPENDKWRATITEDKKMTHIGVYTTEEAAAKAYDREALIRFGKDAVLNFPVQEEGLIPFKFEGRSVRVSTDPKGVPYWVTMDVCKILGLTNPSVAIKVLDADEVSRVLVYDKKGRIKEVTAISESGLFTFIFKSMNPEARKFRKWVTSEVLPIIYRTGKFEGNGMSYGVLESEFSAAVRLTMSLGFSKKRAIAVASKTLQKTHNVNLVELFDISQKEQKMLLLDTVTIKDVAKVFNMSSQKVNTLLNELNFQTMLRKENDPKKYYVVTERGAAYCQPVGYPSLQLLWKPELIEFLQSILPEVAPWK